MGDLALPDAELFFGSGAAASEVFHPTWALSQLRHGNRGDLGPMIAASTVISGSN